MAGGTIWKGYIHFGDTDVPVKLHTAVREERIQFHLLHRRDEVRLRQQMVCAYEKQPVPAEEQSKGFEVEDGKFVIVDPAELERTVPESSRMIEVHEFVKTGQIDPIFLDRLYYLEPDTQDIQGKGYNALVKALKELDVFVPLNRNETTFEDTKTFSKAVAGIMQKHYPDLVTARMAKKERKAKVFINWSQNDASKTMICVYSLRAREKPIVSFPLEWRALENLSGLGDPERLQVTHSEALSRAEEKGDLFREVLVKEQKLPHL